MEEYSLEEEAAIRALVQLATEKDSIEVADEASQRLLGDFEFAVIEAEKAAVETIERAVQRCVRTVDLYLERGMCNFDEVHSFLQKSTYFESFHFYTISKQLYWYQLMVLDRYLVDCPESEYVSRIRERFVLSCNMLLQEKIVSLARQLATIAESALDYRKEDIAQVNLYYKQLENDIKTMRKNRGEDLYYLHFEIEKPASEMSHDSVCFPRFEKSNSEIPFDSVGTMHMKKDKIEKNHDENSRVFFKIKDYLEQEFRNSTDHCNEIARLSLAYCKAAVDRSLEADVPVFDEFIDWTTKVIDHTFETSDKIARAIVEKMNVKEKGNMLRNMGAEYTVKEMDHSKQEQFAASLRQECVNLGKYRIKERREALERYRDSLKTDEDQLIDNWVYRDEEGLIQTMRDLDLSQYKLERIGMGGQGTVYSFDLSGRKVVAKKFHNQKDRREITNLCRIGGHPNILKMICRGHIGDEWYLVVEYCPLSLANELAERRRNGNKPLEKEDFTKWLRQLTSGMLGLQKDDSVMGPGLYHGDLKPENILITEDRRLKIADFGVSLFVRDSTGLDGTSNLRGTPIYKAPELHRGEIDRNLLERADVWSWGVVVWEMVANRRPHDTLDDVQIPVQIGKYSLHPPLPSGAIESLENLLQRCWNSTPEYRPSFRQLTKEIKDVIEEINEMDEAEWIAHTAVWRDAS